MTATIQVRRAPVSIEVDPAGELAYAANSGSNTISVLDLKARREIASIGAGEEPVAARLSPDGKTLVVANRKAGSVSLIDPDSRQLRAVFDGCPGAADLSHFARFVQSLCRMLGRPSDHDPRPGPH